jgi:hypothetical protein
MQSTGFWRLNTRPSKTLFSFPHVSVNHGYNFLLSIFNDNFSLKYVIWGWIGRGHELGRMWKKTALSYMELLYDHVPGDD